MDRATEEKMSKAKELSTIQFNQVEKSPINNKEIEIGNKVKVYYEDGWTECTIKEILTQSEKDQNALVKIVLEDGAEDEVEIDGINVQLYNSSEIMELPTLKVNDIVKVFYEDGWTECRVIQIVDASNADTPMIKVDLGDGTVDELEYDGVNAILVCQDQQHKNPVEIEPNTMLDEISNQNAMDFTDNKKEGQTESKQTEKENYQVVDKIIDDPILVKGNVDKEPSKTNQCIPMSLSSNIDENNGQAGKKVFSKNQISNSHKESHNDKSQSHTNMEEAVHLNENDCVNQNIKNESKATPESKPLSIKSASKKNGNHNNIPQKTSDNDPSGKELDGKLDGKLDGEAASKPPKRYKKVITLTETDDRNEKKSQTKTRKTRSSMSNSDMNESTGPKRFTRSGTKSTPPKTPKQNATKHSSSTKITRATSNPPEENILKKTLSDSINKSSTASSIIRKAKNSTPKSTVTKSKASKNSTSTGRPEKGDKVKVYYKQDGWLNATIIKIKRRRKNRKNIPLVVLLERDKVEDEVEYDGKNVIIVHDNDLDVHSKEAMVTSTDHLQSQNKEIAISKKKEQDSTQVVFSNDLNKEFVHQNDSNTTFVEEVENLVSLVMSRSNVKAKKDRIENLLSTLVDSYKSTKANASNNLDALISLPKSATSKRLEIDTDDYDVEIEDKSKKCGNKERNASKKKNQGVISKLDDGNVTIQSLKQQDEHLEARHRQLNGNQESFQFLMHDTWKSLENVPLGKEGARMMVTFGDGHRPKPETVAAVLMV